MEPPSSNPSLAARRKKIMVHELFPDAKYTMWVDGHIQLTADFVQEVARGKYDIALSGHTNRDCIYQEAEAVMHLKKAETRAVHRQISRYFDEGYPAHQGMVESGVLFRRNKKSIRKLCELWWNEVENETHRDQLSFNYACWKLGIQYTTYPKSIRRDSRVRFHPHLK